MWYASEFNLLSTPNFVSDYAIGSGFGGHTPNVGANEYSPFYLESTADGSYLGRVIRLGPQGSIWHISPIVRTGPDCGRIIVELATVPEDKPGTLGLGGIGAVDTTSLSWFQLNRQNGVPRADLYQSVETEPYNGYVGANGNWRFRIMGKPGIALTATPAFDASDGFQANGGPGLWAIRFKVDGKNASSTGFKFRLHAWHVNRLNASFLSL